MFIQSERLCFEQPKKCQLKKKYGPAPFITIVVCIGFINQNLQKKSTFYSQ